MRQTEHLFDGNSLIPLWNRLDEWEQETESAESWYGNCVDLSDRRFDSAHRAGQRAYITASGLIRLAREHQFLLARTMIGPHAVGVYPHATLNLIRPAFEASLTAFWLLDPDDSRTRVLRGLRQSWEDHRQANSWAEEMFASPLATRETREGVFKKKAEIAKRYHEDADHFQIKWDKVRQKINLVDEIKTLSTVQDDAVFRQALKVTWRQLSGVQHGLSYATLRGGQRIGEVPIPGGSEATIVTDDEWLLTACRMSAAAQAWAMNTYIRRTCALTPRA